MQSAKARNNFNYMKLHKINYVKNPVSPKLQRTKIVSNLNHTSPLFCLMHTLGRALIPTLRCYIMSLELEGGRKREQTSVYASSSLM